MTQHSITPEEWSVFVAALVIYERERKSGWCSGNEYAALQIAVEKYLMSIPCPVPAPLEVRRAIVLKFLAHPGQAEATLATLSFGGGYFGFNWAGMFHGVEPDGYIHT